jgi:hypothetical protein
MAPVTCSNWVSQTCSWVVDLKFIVLPAIAILAIGISYGLYSLSRWGYYLTLIYQIYFGTVSFILLLWGTDGKQPFTSNPSGIDGNLPFIGSFIWSLVVVIYLLMKSHVFTHSKDERQALIS